MVKKHVTVYLTYGYWNGDLWKAPLRIWAHEKPNSIRRLAAKGMRKIIQKRSGIEILNEYQKESFRLRSEDFIADSKSKEVRAMTDTKTLVCAQGPLMRPPRSPERPARVARL